MTSTPVRFRKPLYSVVDDVMPAAWIEECAKVLFYNRLDFEYVSDSAVQTAYFRHAGVEVIAEALVGKLRKRICDLYSNALSACEVPDFRFDAVSVEARLHHHHGMMAWSHDLYDDDGAVITNRMLTWQLIMHTEPRMFSGGEIETPDGATIDVKPNRLVFWHPGQILKMRRVECYSAHPLHGRWSLCGYIHGEAAGWPESIRSLLPHHEVDAVSEDVLDESADPD